MGLIRILISNLKIVILIQIKHYQWRENPKTRKRKCKRIHSVRVEISIQYSVWNKSTSRLEILKMEKKKLKEKIRKMIDLPVR